jgi:hypothetical protein
MLYYKYFALGSIVYYWSLLQMDFIALVSFIHWSYMSVYVLLRILRPEQYILK